MSTGRLEAFTDGVIAILITIMVLELRSPEGTSWSDLRHVVPVLLAYVLSFVHIGIYWNNHHHMLASVDRIGGGALWANLHLLFWLSLVPFTTEWMSEHHFATVPSAVYGIVLLAAAGAYLILARVLVHEDGPDSRLSQALGEDRKGTGSLVLYATGIALTFAYHWLGVIVYAVVAALWLVPDRRIERSLASR